MDRTIKGKILIVFFEITIGTIINVYISSYLHNLLSNNALSFIIPTFSESISSIILNRQNLLLFSSFEVLTLLIAVYIMTTKTKAYQSKLQMITPNIYTPVPAGQKQFGSARWMKREEKEKVFSVCKLDTRDSLISYLIKSGDSDIKNNDKGVDEDI